METNKEFSLLIFLWIFILSTSSHPVVVNLANHGLTAVPSNIRPDVTSLDLSNNKIRKIYKTDLQTYTRLEELFLQDNQINTIEEGSFKTIGNLTIMNLSGNKMDLSNYSALLFDGLKNLKHLDLRHNLKSESGTVRYYPDKAFSILSDLTFLGLDLDRKPVFGEGFKNLSKLESLSFENCYIDRLGNETFHYFPKSVLSLSITNCQTHFVDVEAGALLPFTRLESLDLSRSCIHLIQALMMIKPFRNRNFKTLNFYGLNCPYYNSERYPFTLIITPEMTQNLQTMCIENLNMGDNGIADIRPNSLLKLYHPECLKNLTMRENRFFIEYGTRLSEVREFFANCKNLKMLDMSFMLGRYNPEYIQAKSSNFGLYSSSPSIITEQTFSNIHSDNTLQNNENISQTSFQSIQKRIDDRKGSSSLLLSNSQESVIVMPNSLEIIVVNNVITYDYMKVFYIKKGSKLRYMDASFSNVHSSVILLDPTANLKIETLVIDGVRYASLLTISAGFHNSSIINLVWRASYLQEMVHKLQKRDLKDNDKLLIFLKKLKTLEKLVVSHNYLYQWDRQIFEQINLLKTLDFSYNSFQNIPEETHFLEHLNELDFRHNRLTTVEERIRTWADNMHEKNNFRLHLADNAFKCDCNNLDFITWLKNTKVKLDRKSYLCTLQNGTLIDTSLAYTEMNKLFKDCSADFWLTASIASLCCFVIVSVLILVYSRRWNVTLYFYKKFKFLLQKKYQRSFSYDVYVSYDSESLSWIKDTLIPKLEKTWKLKLCLRDRDSLPGCSIFDSEASNIEMSRHALFVIGKTFKTECERLFEVEQVKYEKLVKNIENIIIIAKDVDVSELPVELAFLWRYVSFLSWSNNDRDLEVIWKKLQIWTCDALSYETPR